VSRKKLATHFSAKECVKLDPDFEKSIAEEGLSEELSGWPEY
jgi:hypothetical protein